MARNGEFVEVSTEVLKQLHARIEQLEHAERIRQEALLNPHAQLLDPIFEKHKEDVSRPASVRTQEKADKLYGMDQPRFRVTLDSGPGGPNVSEHPALEISAHSPEEAEARWLKLCGITRHEYQVRVSPLTQVA